MALQVRDIVLKKTLFRGIELLADFEYFTRQGTLKLRGDGNNGFANFDSNVTNSDDHSANDTKSRQHQHSTLGHVFAGIMYKYVKDQ